MRLSVWSACLYTMCMHGLWGSEEDMVSPGSGVTGSYLLPCESWD